MTFILISLLTTITFILIIIFFKYVKLVIRNIFGQTIEIKEYHIKNGKTFDQTKCAIALAIQEKLDNKYGKNEREVWVCTNNDNGFHIAIALNNKAFYSEETKWSHHCFLPKKLKKFMNDFDSGIEVKPLKFKLII